MAARSLYAELKKQALLTPDRLSVVNDDGSKVTTSQLLKKVERCAFYLEESAPAAKYVILIAHGSADYHAWSIAILGRGRVLVPIDLSWPATRINEVKDQIFEIDPNAAVIRSKDAISTHEHLQADLDLQPDSPALIFFTSGTTGKPKGVVLSYGFLLNQATDIERDELWSSVGSRQSNASEIHDALFQYASISVAVHLNYCIAIVRGHTVVCVTGPQALDIPYAVELFARYQIKRILITPTFCERLLDFPEWFSTFTEISFFGEILNETLLVRLLDQLPQETRLTDCYGQTEMALWVAKRDLRADSTWHATPGSGLEIRNGELCVVDRFEHSLFLGYLGAPPREPGDLLSTGDLAEGTPQRFQLKGRSDDMRKVRGFRIELEGIESVLTRLTQRQSATAVKDDMLLAFVCRAETTEEDIEFERRIKSEMREILPSQHVPSRIFLVDEIPLTETLKINRTELLNRTEWKSDDAISSDRILRIFRALFPFEKNFDDHSSFSDLGGHSLLVLKAMGLFRAEGLEGTLSPAEFLRLDTVGKIREALRQPVVPTSSGNSILPITRALSRLPPLRTLLLHPRKSVNYIRELDRTINITRITVPVGANVSDREIEQNLEKLTCIHPVLKSRARRKGSRTLPEFSQSSPPVLDEAISPYVPWGLRNGDPLFRASRLPDGSVRLMIHHGISDNQSCQVLARDFRSLLDGQDLLPRPYANLNRVRQILEALPLRCPYSVPGGNLVSRDSRWNRAFPLDVKVSSALVLPSLLLSFSRAWKGPIEVPVYMDARNAPELLDVDATQLVSFLAITRSAKAEPTMSLSDVRKSLDLPHPQYYRGTSFRGGFSDIVMQGSSGSSARRIRNRGQGDILLNVVESGGMDEQPDGLTPIRATMSEIRNPEIASIYAEYYMDSERLFVNAFGPTKSWVEDLATSIHELLAGADRNEP